MTEDVFNVSKGNVCIDVVFDNMPYNLLVCFNEFCAILK